ncbi:MAG: AAA domain-containing protein [Chloroflexi bacterium]|nr:AAA domain-containing protein [Chloroflexota bacterium]
MTFYTVFDPQNLLILAKVHQDAFTTLGSIEKDLNTRFAEMQDPILAIILAVASGESLLFNGPPGTAKSWLVRAFCHYIGIDPDKSGETDSDNSETDYFEYLLTPFTEPGELFGYFDIAEASKSDGKLVRDDSGMIQNAKVVYLDEVFKGSSAILNSLLAFMNERVFHDRGKRIPVKVHCLFGATNQVPYTSELRAIYDRFILRCDIRNLEARPKDMRDLLNKGWMETYRSPKPTSFPNLLDQLQDFRGKANDLLTGANPITGGSDDFLGKLTMYVSNIRRRGLSEMSNRRIIKFLSIMMVHSIYRSANVLERAQEIRKKKGKPTDNENEILKYAETLVKHGIRFTDQELLLYRFMVDRRDEFDEEHLMLEQS